MTAALLDVDGTLVDSNYHHVIAWARAFARHDLAPSLWQVHRAIGMGGDRLVAAVLGDDVEAEHGDDVRAAWKQEFDRLLGEVRVVDGAPELLRGLHERGWQVVLASSGKPDHVDHFVDLLGCRDLLAAVTTGDDAEGSKPATDILQVALDQVGEREGVMVGDSRWDFVSSRRAGLPGVGVLTGGFSEPELRDAGADEVWRQVRDLADDLDRSRLRAP